MFEMSSLTFEDIPRVFTKENRKQIISEGRRGSEDEKFQKHWLKKKFGLDLGPGTAVRCNLFTGEFIKSRRITHRDDFEEWTEDFDGYADGIYFSLKMITCAGGAQTRSIREVAHHIKACVRHLENYDSSVKFAFILDGGELAKYLERFKRKIPQEFQKNFYIGPLKDFSKGEFDS